MGGIDPITLAITAATAVSGAISSRKKAKAQSRRIEEDRRRETEELTRRQDVDDRNRREALKRALATQRARAAGGGFDPFSGSSSAVLRRLNKDTNQAIADDREELNFQVGSINRSASRTQKDLLKRTQKDLTGRALKLGRTAVSLLNN